MSGQKKEYVTKINAPNTKSVRQICNKERRRAMWMSTTLDCATTPPPHQSPLNVQRLSAPYIGCWTSSFSVCSLQGV